MDERYITITIEMKVGDREIQRDVEDTLNLILPYFGDNVTIDVEQDE